MTQQAAVAEVAPESVTGTVVSTFENHPKLRAMVIALGNETRLQGASTSADEFVMSLLEQILQAESFEDIFAAQENGGSIAGQDFTMRPFHLKGEDITILPSRLDTGFPFYALMQVTEQQTGETVAVNCGGKTFMAVLYGLRENGYFTAEKGCPPEGRSLMIKATESGDGAYLSLLPFAGAAKPAATARAKK
jgi:hypothetical protein